MASATTFAVKVWRDSEVVYMPHWLESDGSTVIMNSADGAFPKPIVEPIAIGVIHGIKWVSSYSDGEFKTQINATNSDGWRGWSAGQAWISRILTEEENINDEDVIKVHYIIRCNEFGWNAHIAQMGYFYKDAGNKAIFDEGIGLLDGSGNELALGSPAVDADIQVKRRISFGSTLGF